MSLWQQPPWAPETKLQRRVQRMSEGDMHDWVDSSLYGIGKTLSLYRSNREPAFLTEVKLASTTLCAIVQELENRAGRH